MRYVAEKKKTGEFARSTAKTNWYTLAAFADAVGADMPVGRVTRKHVEKWRLTRNVSPGTARAELSRVRAFCKWCVENDLMRRDPTRGIKGPRQPRREPRAIGHDGIAETLLHADDRGRVCILLGVQEGLRRAEVCGLTTDRVDLEDQLLTVLGKGNKERVVPLSHETAKAIDRYLTAYPAGPGMPLIRSYEQPTKGLHPDHLTRLAQRWMTDAGVKKGPGDGKSFHALRHTCANDVLDAGADLRDVQELLGHEHLATTQRYLRRHVALGRLRDAASGRNYSG